MCSWWKTAWAVFVLCVATGIASPAQTFTTLFRFNFTDGDGPDASLVQGPDGNFYGTTFSGGAEDIGTVFRVTPTGKLTTLYSFGTQPTDGRYPTGLVLGTDENFYGITSAGGVNNFGTVFRITRGGLLTTLHSFDGADGEGPTGALVEGTDGSFYGMTEFGGANTCLAYYGSVGCGTIFKITSQGGFTSLRSFDSSEPWEPLGALIQATDGNLYGTTDLGGANDRGTVFKMSPDGTLTTLYSFCAEANCADGDAPYAGLIQATNGDFYGTTANGDASSCPYYDPTSGTVFKITPQGALTTLGTFCGFEPFAPLIQATDGNLYGTSVGGGVACTGIFLYGCGFLFKVTPADAFKVLHDFYFTDGAGPEAALTQATSGVFYGTTADGGFESGTTCVYYGCGTLFSLNVGLGAFVTTLPGARQVGEGVIILGTSLTGSTSVTFNGTAAVFTIVSPTEIATTVPAGATTGTVRVATPNGTLSSNVPFRVLP